MHAVDSEWRADLSSTSASQTPGRMQKSRSLRGSFIRISKKAGFIAGFRVLGFSGLGVGPLKEASKKVPF